MKLGDLEALDDQHLWVVVFGPGFGESIVLRSPTDDWIVIDSCKYPENGQNPAARFIEQFNGAWDARILTHPHLDHGQGFDELIEQPGGGPVGAVHPEIEDPGKWDSSDDDVEREICGSLEATVAAIQREWQENESRKWPLRRGDEETIGPLRLEVLHPDATTLPTDRSSLNDISSPILVEWEEARILLGADLPAGYWDSLESRYPRLHDHCLLKIPHHCSQNSVSSIYGGGQGTDEERTWIGTPFSQSNLPRFEAGRGVEQLLGFVECLQMTSIPGRYHDPPPMEGSRAELCNGKFEKTVGEFGGLEQKQLDEPGEPKGFRYFVGVEVRSDGTCGTSVFGKGSATVRR